MRGTYTHAPSAVVFPEQLGWFGRVSIDRFDDEGLDVGVGYNLGSPAVVVATFFVTPRLRRSDGAPQALEERFRWEAEGALAHHDGAALTREATVPIRQAGSLVLCRLAELSYAELFAQQIQALRSLLYVCPLERWVVKYRITYPAAQEDRVLDPIADLLERFQWRGAPSAPGEAGWGSGPSGVGRPPARPG